MNHTCRICGEKGEHPIWQLQERMFGLGDTFTYFKCFDCGCLQISSPPVDWRRYYPPHYYSYSLTNQVVRQTGLRSLAAGFRDRAFATGRRAWCAWLDKPKFCFPHLSALRRIPLNRQMRILDVGCGRGQLLSVLHRAGFQNLAGVDPFLSADQEVSPGVWVKKQSVESVSGSFDLIMLHHVLEHVEQQRYVLVACRERLAPDGRILVRIPTIECAVWERYRENAVQLDAPRHLFLHSRASLDSLARDAGLRVESRWCDSTEFQFWGSELYCRGLPLTDATGKPTDPARHFDAGQLESFAREADRLNAEDLGDQWAAVMTPLASVPPMSNKLDDTPT